MKVYAVDINSRLVDFHYFIHKLPPQIIKYINFLCYTCSSNISILSTIQARLLLYSLSKWRTSGLHSQLPGQEQLIPFSFCSICQVKTSYAEFELYFMWVLLRVHDGFWKIVSAHSHLTVLVLASGDFLAVFFLFQNLSKSSKIHNETVSCRPIKHYLLTIDL